MKFPLRFQILWPIFIQIYVFTHVVHDIINLNPYLVEIYWFLISTTRFKRRPSDGHTSPAEGLTIFKRRPLFARVICFDEHSRPRNNHNNCFTPIRVFHTNLNLVNSGIMTKLILAAALVASLFTVNADGPLAVGLSCCSVISLPLQCNAKLQVKDVLLHLFRSVGVEIPPRFPLFLDMP